MRNIWTIARREYNLFFSTPMAYMVAFLFFLVMGVLFYSNIVAALFQQMTPDIQVVLGPMTTLILFVTPALTMRLLAAEQSSGTIELLLTAPVQDWELVLGKWLGSFLFMCTLFLVTLLYPIILNRLITPGIDQGLLVSGYLGIILMGAALSAIGVAISSMFKNQNAAFFATLGIFLLLWLIGVPAEASGSLGSNVLRYLDFRSHYFSTLFRGVIELNRPVFVLRVGFR
jgi:ABC-2 type transport system permease protein